MDNKQLVGKIHSHETSGTVDGPGIRYVVFMQGCPLRCKYCHNPDSWHIKDGKDITVKDLIEKIKPYKSFMHFSKGGVTVSGGEPLLQIPFVKELFKQLKDIGIHTALDTSGFAYISDELNELLDYTDLVLLDIKHLDNTIHKKLTGVENLQIKKFIDHLQKRNIPIWIRYVIVDGYTADLDYARQLAEFAAQYSIVEKVELLPYHDMGKYKWKELGYDYDLLDVEPSSREVIDSISKIFTEKGLPILVC